MTIDFPRYYAFDSPYHQKRRTRTVSGVRACISSAIDLLGCPASVLDLGCAEGAPVEWWRQQGVNAHGVDIAVPPGVPYLTWGDLRQPLRLGRTFSWVTCWEVAEHLPSLSAETLCDSVARHLAPEGLAIFTAAGPGQDGRGHLHLQPQSYWRGLLEARGLRWDEGASGRLRDRWLAVASSSWWYGANAMVFHG
jgi:hypothetical protein